MKAETKAKHQEVCRRLYNGTLREGEKLKMGNGRKTLYHVTGVYGNNGNQAGARAIARVNGNISEILYSGNGVFFIETHSKGSVPFERHTSWLAEHGHSGGRK